MVRFGDRFLMLPEEDPYITTNLRFTLFYVEYQMTKHSGWYFGQPLSGQYLESTPNSVWTIFWMSFGEFVLRRAQRDHDYNIVAYLVYIRYLQVLLYLQRTTLYGEQPGLPSTMSYWENYLHTGILAWRFHRVYFLYLIVSLFSYGGIHWTIIF